MEQNEIKDYTCQFCNTKFSKQNALKLHIKTAKFCIEIQKKINAIVDNTQTEEFKCEFCNKDCSNKKYLNQHVASCKKKKEKLNDNIKQDLENIKKYVETIQKELEDSKKEIIELKVYNKVKDESIEKLQKELNKVQKEQTKPTKVYNKFVQNNNNCQIQYNKLCEKITPFTGENLNNKIKNIKTCFIYEYDDKNIERSFSKNLTDIFKDFIFCIDKENKMVVYKEKTGNAYKMDINEFINIGLNLGIKDIQNILSVVEKYYNKKLDNDIIDEETYQRISESLTKIRDFLTNSNIDINLIDNNPLQELPELMISNIEYCKLR
jgi:hypothetical protein